MFCDIIYVVSFKVIFIYREDASKMKKNYYELAANWWRKTIQNSEGKIPHGIDIFEEELSSKIKYLSSLNGSMVISTFQSPSRLLEDIAFHSGLDAKIPRGYEMHISFNNVLIYDSIGALVESF